MLRIMHVNFDAGLHHLCLSFLQEVDTRRVGEIGFEGFASLYHNLIHDEVVSNYFYIYIFIYLSVLFLNVFWLHLLFLLSILKKGISNSV